MGDDAGIVRWFVRLLLALVGLLCLLALIIKDGNDNLELIYFLLLFFLSVWMVWILSDLLRCIFLYEIHSYLWLFLLSSLGILILDTLSLGNLKPVILILSSRSLSSSSFWTVLSNIIDYLKWLCIDFICLLFFFSINLSSAGRTWAVIFFRNMSRLFSETSYAIGILD